MSSEALATAWAIISPPHAHAARPGDLEALLADAGIGSQEDLAFALLEAPARVRDFVDAAAACLKLAAAGRFRAAMSAAAVAAKGAANAAGGAAGGNAGGGGEAPSAAPAHLVVELLHSLPARLLALLRTVDGGAASPSSLAQRGRGVLSVLEHIKGGIVDEAPIAGREPVLRAAEQAALEAAADADGEEGVVRYMTPVLARLRGCASHTAAAAAAAAGDPAAPLLVNSERLQWLEHAAGGGLAERRLKPDLFRSWAPFVELRSGGDGQGDKDDGYVFGVLGGVALQRAGCVSEVYEAKAGSSIARSHFGELCAFHDALGSGVHRGVLFCARTFWLYKTVNASPVKLVRARWTDGGSAEVFRAFFERDALDALDAPEPPLLVLLRALLARLGVAPCAAADGRSCYLGSGATGHVFAVRARAAPRGAPLLALKVVLAASAASVGAEFTRMRTAAEAGAPVIAPIDGSLSVVDAAAGAAGGGGGFLLSRVGAAAGAASARACERAFAALAALHGAGVVHGDARLANLLEVEGELRWVDLLGGLADATERAAPAFRQLARADAETLAHSVLRRAAPAALPDAARAAAGDYAAALASGSGAAAAAVALARIVWAAAADAAAQR